MVKYINFDQFFVEGAGKNKEDRIAFTRKWLQENYKIVDANPEWVDQLSDVHDHDSQPLHFGQIKIASSFSSLTTQLIKVHNVWHMGILKPNSNEANVVHPIRENQTAENEKHRLNLVKLVKNGTVPKAEEPVYGIQFDPIPATLAVGDIYGKADAETPTEMHEDTISAPVSENTPTKSVSVDLSAFL